ncbi:SMI1/KNR4 family protein [Clostridium thailandense]|uniref:SMI1/KNR4 family protein n=1 Tax=Clostridium thailandense TaxID=2794346 RepID=UPI003988F44B
MLENNFEKVEKKLSEIIDLSIFNKVGMHSESEIIDIEKKYNINFPEEYRMFVAKYGNATIKDDIYYKPIEKSSCTPDDGFDSLGVFYGFKEDNVNLCKMIERYLGRMPQSLVPIAEAQGGNQICIGVEGDVFGKIYLWNHENESLENDECWSNLSLIAESLFDLIMSFEIYHRKSNVNLDDIEVWLDDELFND